MVEVMEFTKQFTDPNALENTSLLEEKIRNKIKSKVNT